MVDVGVRDKNVINLGNTDRELFVFKEILSLFHTIVNEDLFTRRLKKMAAARHFVIGTDKGQFHKHTSLWYHYH